MIFLRQYSALGMPYHGKAVDGELTTPDGTKTINGEGGCVVVRHPQAPGATRDTAQQAIDTAHGFEWRDYALLCGNSRAINGGPEIGSNAWLYCAADGRTWVMTVEKNYTSGDIVTWEIWRRDLFGNFKTDGPWSITDEKVGQYAMTFALPDEYDGVLTAAQCADNATVNVAAAIVPNPAGSSVYVHVLCSNDVYNATTVNIGGMEREVAAIMEVAISGNGDVTAAGVGISATFPDVDDYDALRVTSDDTLNYGELLSTAYPDWDGCSLLSQDPDPTPDPPLSAGLTYDQETCYLPDNAGEVNDRVSGPGEYRKGTVYRTHQGDVVVTRYNYSIQRFYDEIIGSSWCRTLHYESIEDPENPGEYIWELQDTTYDTSYAMRHYEYTELRDEIRLQFGAIDIHEYLLSRDAYSIDDSSFSGVGGFGCTVDWPCNACGSTAVPALFDSSLGTLSGGMAAHAVDLSGGVYIIPGIVRLAYGYDHLDNDGDREYHYEWVGIGESDLVNFASYNFSYTAAVQPPASNLIPYYESFQPVTEEGDYALGPTSDSIQYC